jgi:hypothetical protein
MYIWLKLVLLAEKVIDDLMILSTIEESKVFIPSSSL